MTSLSAKPLSEEHPRRAVPSEGDPLGSLGAGEPVWEEPGNPKGEGCRRTAREGAGRDKKGATEPGTSPKLQRRRVGEEVPGAERRKAELAGRGSMPGTRIATACARRPSRPVYAHGDLGVLPQAGVRLGRSKTNTSYNPAREEIQCAVLGSWSFGTEAGSQQKRRPPR